MEHISFKLLAIMPVVCLATCKPPMPPGLTVRASDVEESKLARRHLSGRFYIGPPLSGDEIIPSNGSGGACLLAQFRPLDPKKCTVHETCDVYYRPPSAGSKRPSPINPRPEQKWLGYCLKKKGQAEGVCWVRPGSPQAFCTYRTAADPHGELNVPAEGVDVTAAYRHLGAEHASLQQGILWQVYACLNPANPDNPKEDVATCGRISGPAPLAKGSDKFLRVH